MTERQPPELRAALVYTPLPDRETAREVIGSLLDERLIACGNLIGPIESVFIWEGKRSSDTEVAVLLKTTNAKLEVTTARLAALHPYETPVIVATVCDAAHPSTLSWLAEQLC